MSKTRVYIRLILIVVYAIVFFSPHMYGVGFFFKFCDEELNCTAHCKHCRVKLSPDVNRRSSVGVATYNITKIFGHIFDSYVGM